MINIIQEQILSTLSPKIKELIEKCLPEKVNLFEWIVNHPHQYHDPFLLPDVAKGIKIIKNAIFNGEKIALFGDKDVDGITAIATFTRFLDSLIKTEDTDREKKLQFSYIVLFEEEENADYGLSQKIVEESYSEGCSLLITFDTGTSDFAAIGRANELGIKVIVIDHHEPKGEIPPAHALINPKRKDSKYPFNGLATAGLVWKFCHAFLVSFGKALVFVWKDGMQIRQEGEVWNFHNFSDMISYLNNYTEKEINQKFRFMADARETKEKFLEKSMKIGLNIEMEVWTDIVEIFFQGLESGNSAQGGFHFWGNPLTGLSGLEIIKQYFHGHNGEEPLPKYFLVMQLCTSVKLQKLLFPLLTLVAVGTLADMMPLEEENRIFSRIGLNQLREGQDRSFKVMMDRMGIWASHVRSRNISWSLVPVLNSPGRIGSGSETLNFLLSDQNRDRLHFIEALLERNRERKNLVEIGRKAAIDQILNSNGQEEEPLAVGFMKNLPFGITGLVASRVADYFEKPAVIFMQNSDKVVASARSFAGTNVLDMVESAKSYLLLFGGHKEAAGFSFSIENLNPVSDLLLEYAKKHFVLSMQNPEAKNPNRQLLEMDIEEVNLTFIKQLDWLEPFGIGNEEPIFLIKNIPPLNFKDIGKNKNHGKFSFLFSGKGNSNSDGFSGSAPVFFEVIGWDMAKKMKELADKKEPFSAKAELDLNYFRGELRINLIISKILDNI